MDNKLSELSKPVAWTWNAYGMQHATTEEDESAELILDGVDVNPLYSQEYVSALRGDAAKWFKVFEKAVSVGARYEERIAELEERLALVREQRDNELRTNSELEKLLATPVRLPELCGDGENDNEYTEGLNDGINQSAKAVRAAGFTVEGDE